MTFQARGSVLAALALAVFAGRADAVDPQQSIGLQSDYLSPAYSNPAYSNPGLGFPSSSLPTGRDRLQDLQRITVPDPNRIALPDNTLGSTVRISPVNGVTPSPLVIPGGPQAQQPQRWRLGVYSKDTETGVRVVQVVNGSAAMRAGLEAQDVIVSVNGYQVGFVNGQLFDCATEFERWATSDGWVRLLVQNNRNGQLMTLPLQLESRLSKISGSIALNDRQPLPADAYVTVELQEILRTGAPPITLASQTIDRPRNFPIPFEISFDPQQVDTRRSYVVTGRVLSNRQTLYAPQQLVQVLTPGQPSSVNLAFTRVAANPGAPIGPYSQSVGLEEVVQFYQLYLGRQPTAQELAVWQRDLQHGTALVDVRSNILGQNQFFNQCDRDERIYIERLHELVLGRKPYPQELEYWTSRYQQQNGVRTEIAREFLAAVGAPN